MEEERKIKKEGYRKEEREGDGREHSVVRKGVRSLPGGLSACQGGEAASYWENLSGAPHTGKAGRAGAETARQTGCTSSV